MVVLLGLAALAPNISTSFVVGCCVSIVGFFGFLSMGLCLVCVVDVFLVVIAICVVFVWVLCILLCLCCGCLVCVFVFVSIFVYVFVVWVLTVGVWVVCHPPCLVSSFISPLFELCFAVFVWVV